MFQTFFNSLNKISQWKVDQFRTMQSLKQSFIFFSIVYSCNLKIFWFQIRALLGERVHERTEQWRNNTNSRLLREIKDPSTLHEAFQFLVKVCIEQKDIEGINKLIVGNTWTRAGSKVGKAGIIAKAVIRKWRLSKPYTQHAVSCRLLQKKIFLCVSEIHSV